MDASCPGGWWQPPPWWSNSDEFESSWFFGNKELRSKNGVGWSQRLRMAEVFPKVLTGREVGG